MLFSSSCVSLCFMQHCVSPASQPGYSRPVFAGEHGLGDGQLVGDRRSTDVLTNTSCNIQLICRSRYKKHLLRVVLSRVYATAWPRPYGVIEHQKFYVEGTCCSAVRPLGGSAHVFVLFQGAPGSGLCFNCVATASP